DGPKDVGGMMPILLLADNIVTWISHAYKPEGKTTKTTLLPVSWKYEHDELEFEFIDPADLTRSSSFTTTEAMTSPAALFDTTLDWLAELALSRGEVLVGRCELSPPSDEPWAWLGDVISRQPPVVDGALDGDVAAALRRPHREMAQGTPTIA